MDNLQWFKFSPSHWFMGRIQRCSEVAQARFMRIVCIYWNNECQMSVDDAKIELDEEFNNLVRLKIIEVENDEISIKFLDTQYEDCLTLGNKRSEAAKARWSKAKAKQKESKSMQLHNVAMQDNADKIREEEIREDKKHKLHTWIDANASRVNKMKESLTFEECERLKKDYHSDFIVEILTSMHNYEPLLRKNRNANMTFRNWANRDERYEKWKQANGKVEIKMNT